MGKKKTIDGEEPEASKRPRTRKNKDPNLIGEAQSYDSIEQNSTMGSNEEREESFQAEPLDEGELSAARPQQSFQLKGSQDTDLLFR